MSKCLRTLIAFSVALALPAARAQTPSSPNLMLGGSQQDTTQSCANGDVSACESLAPSSSTNGLSGEGSTGSSSSFGFPSINPGSPNTPTSVYRDDADGMNRAEWLRQQRLQLQKVNKPQPLSEFQMLRSRLNRPYCAGLWGRSVYECARHVRAGAAASRNSGLCNSPGRRGC